MSTAKQRLCVGLTGGIGSGKSTVSKLFQNLGAYIIDTDEIAHQLTRVGGGAMTEVVSVFGHDYLDSDGALDRAKMRKLIFSNAGAKAKLEAVLHPLIRVRVQKELAGEPDAPYVILVVPLLLQSPAYKKWVHRILVVDCAEEKQIERVRQRSHLSEVEVRGILAQQSSRAERLRIATDLIDNNGSLERLEQQVHALHQIYFAISD